MYPGKYTMLAMAAIYRSNNIVVNTVIKYNNYIIYIESSFIE